MKNLINLRLFKQALLLCVLTVTNALVWAQDSTMTSTTTTTATSETQTWYTEPWVWVVGGAVLILLIVALVRGSCNSGSSSTASRTDKVTVTKSTEVE
ncbi:MAG: hypothetical protein WAR80_14385 [Ferruginibacter sp.]